MTETARLALPLIEPGQAQKELFHNEALLRIDAATQAVVASVGMAAPPAGARGPGTCHATGAAPTGEWAGHPLAIAAWTAGGWRFVPTAEGMCVWDAGSGTVVRRGAAGWRAAAVVAPPAGGATVDAEARQTLAALVVALRLQGLLAG